MEITVLRRVSVDIQRPGVMVLLDSVRALLGGRVANVRNRVPVELMEETADRGMM